MVRPILERGGASQAMTLLAVGLRQQGHQVSVATCGGHGVAGMKAAAIPLLHIPLSYRRFIPSVLQLAQIGRRQQIHLYHSHHRLTNLMCRMAGLLTGIPTVTTVHEFKTNRRLLTRLGMGRQVIVHSQALKEHLVHHYGLPSSRITVVSPAIAMTELSPACMQAARAVLPESDALRFGSLARFEVEKGMDILLQAVHRLPAQDNPFQLILVGDGPERPALEAQVQGLGLTDKVYFAGWQDNVAGCIAHLDFLVLPSRSEGTGLVILEGWLQGRPTIASQVGGIPEIIQHGVDGWLVPPNDPAALAAAIDCFLRQSKMVERLGRAGQQQLPNRFSQAQLIARTELIYKSTWNR
jgi:glycosyltransferase involved in cell wall biosynthesis